MTSEAERVEERFWSKVDRSGGSEACWPWLAAKTRGYGSFAAGGRLHRATHFAIRLDGRDVAKGQVVMHRCDNPPCVNPAHLVVGAQGDNVRDMWEKGRGANYPTMRGEPGWQARKTHCKRGHPFTPDNIKYLAGGTKRNCRTCVNAADARRRQRIRDRKREAGDE